MADGNDKALRVPERVVPVPSHASDMAKAVLSQPFPPATEYPALDDNAGWKETIAQRELFLAQMFEKLWCEGRQQSLLRWRPRSSRLEERMGVRSRAATPTTPCPRGISEPTPESG